MACERFFADVTAIPLGRRLPGASSNLPGRQDPDTDPEARSRKLRAVPIRSCSRWGLPCRRRYRRRGALLPHRFTLAAANSTHRGGLFSVALSLGSHPPDVIRHRLSMEPGLSSPANALERPSDRLTKQRDGDEAPPRQGARQTAVKARPAAWRYGPERPWSVPGPGWRATPAACCALTGRRCRRCVPAENGAGRR